MSRHTEEIVTKVVGFRDHIKTFENTVDVVIQDGRIDLPEADALIGLLNSLQTDIGKFIYRVKEIKRQVELGVLPIASTGIELDLGGEDES